MFGTIVLYTHIVGAVLGLLAGMLAMLFRKGSGLHAAAGTVFFVSMIAMSVSAVYVSMFVRPVAINTVVGTLTFYLVVTAWWAAKRRDGRIRPSDRAAFVYICGVAALAFAYGVRAAVGGERNRGVPLPMYFLFGGVAALLAASDVRMFRRGGYAGTRRIVRHLWRMGLALLIAMLSLYPGRPSVFPQSWRATNLLTIPHILVFGALVTWLFRLRARRPSRVVESTTPIAANAAARS